jgi:pyruvate,water dikinase
LIEVVEALKKYFSLGGSKEYTSIDERIGVRVSIIYRFLAENLRYINIAKHYVYLTTFERIFGKIVGPGSGTGKVGGKSAGIILAENILKVKKKENPVLENVYTPKSWFITSDGILEFINYNALDEFTHTKYDAIDHIKLEYQFIEYVFKNSAFPPEYISSLKVILDDLDGKPIVVRSSSLLEDSFEAAFTGKYKSLFISNIGSKEERLSALMNAIAEVYASTFAPDPIAYRKERGLIDFREEMGILIQEVVGNKIGKYFLPSFAGVAFSNNEFRWTSRLKREDGVVRMVAGLGTRAVDRTFDDYPIMIAPGSPNLRLNQSVEATVKYSQVNLDVINLDTNQFETISFNDFFKESNGYFPGLENIVSFYRSNMIVDPISKMADFKKEDLIITFNNLINKTTFISQIKEILKELSKAYESPVDIEFASDGKKLYLLQCRPQSQFENENVVQIPKDINPESIIFSANEFINNGIVENIEYVVYVDAEAYSELTSISEMQEVGNIVNKLNKKLPRRKFILIGPGRWGSKGDIKLGVPVIYSDINNSAMLIEVAKRNADYVPELSFGTHFFQDLVEANIKYLPLYPDKNINIFNDGFFYKTPNSLTQFIENVENYESVVRLINVSHFKKDCKLNIFMDGEKSQAFAIITI